MTSTSHDTEIDNSAFYPSWESVSRTQSDPFAGASQIETGSDLVDIPTERSSISKTHVVLRNFGAVIIGFELGIMADIVAYYGIGLSDATSICVGAFAGGIGSTVARYNTQ